MATTTTTIGTTLFGFTDTDGNKVSVRAQVDPSSPSRVQLVAVAKDGTEAVFQHFEMAGGGRLSAGPIDCGGSSAFVLVDTNGFITWAG